MAKTEIHKNKNMRTGMTNYPVGDFLIRIKNAAMARTRDVEINDSKFILSVAEALQKEGYLDTVTKKDGKLLVRLAYHRKAPVLLGVELVSKPGLRIYTSSDEVAKSRGSFVYILSTSKGIMSSLKAIKMRLGGEVIAKIY